MDEILHHLRDPAMLIPRKIPTRNGFFWLPKVVQSGFRAHPQYFGWANKLLGTPELPFARERRNKHLGGDVMFFQSLQKICLIFPCRVF